jgi:hypothetical protein
MNRTVVCVRAHMSKSRECSFCRVNALSTQSITGPTLTGISDASSNPQKAPAGVFGHAIMRHAIRNFSRDENRLKTRFNFVASNGDLLQVFDFNGAPKEIRTPDPQIRSQTVRKLKSTSSRSRQRPKSKFGLPDDPHQFRVTRHLFLRRASPAKHRRSD